MLVLFLTLMMLMMVHTSLVESTVIDTHTTWKRKQVIQLGSDLIIAKNTSLFIEQGVRVLLAPGVNIFINGFIRIDGTVDEPVWFHSVLYTNYSSNSSSTSEDDGRDSVPADKRWGYMEFTHWAMPSFVNSRGETVQSAFNHVRLMHADTAVLGGSVILEKPYVGTRSILFNDLVIRKSGGIEADDGNSLYIHNCAFSSDTMGTGFGARGGVYLSIRNSTFDGYGNAVVLENFNEQTNLHDVIGNTFVNNQVGIQPRSSATIEGNRFIFPNGKRMIAIQTDPETSDASTLVIQDNRFEQCQYESITIASVFNYVLIERNSFSNCALSMGKPIFQFKLQFKATLNILYNRFENISAISVNEYSFLSLGSTSLEVEVQFIGNHFKKIYLPTLSTLISILHTDTVVVKRNTFSQLNVKYIFLLPQVRDGDVTTSVPYIDASLNRYLDISDETTLFSKIKNHGVSKFAYIALFPAYLGSGETETYVNPDLFNSTERIVTGERVLSGNVLIPVNGRVYEAGSRLTITPGTVLTLTGSLIVLGELIIQGTSENPVVIYGSSFSALYMGSTVTQTVLDSSGVYVSGSIVEYAHFETRSARNNAYFLLSFIQESNFVIRNILCDLSVDSSKQYSCLSIRQISKVEKPSMTIVSSAFSNCNVAVLIRDDRQVVNTNDTITKSVKIQESTFSQNSIAIVYTGVRGAISNSKFLGNTYALQTSFTHLSLYSNKFNESNVIQDLNSYVYAEQNVFSNIISTSSYASSWVRNKFITSMVAIGSESRVLFTDNNMDRGLCLQSTPISIISPRITFHRNVVKQHNCQQGVVQLEGGYSATASVMNNTFAGNTVDTDRSAIFQTDITDLKFRFNGFAKNNNARYFFIKLADSSGKQSKVLDLRFNFWAGISSASSIRQRIGATDQKDSTTFMVAPFFVVANVDSSNSLKCDGGVLPDANNECPQVVPSGRKSFRLPVIVLSSIAGFLIVLMLIVSAVITLVVIKIREQKTQQQPKRKIIRKSYTESDAKQRFLSPSESEAMHSDDESSDTHFRL